MKEFLILFITTYLHDVSLNITLQAVFAAMSVQYGCARVFFIFIHQMWWRYLACSLSLMNFYALQILREAAVIRVKAQPRRDPPRRYGNFDEYNQHKGRTKFFHACFCRRHRLSHRAQKSQNHAFTFFT